MPLEIVRNDITKMAVDAIVNAANSSLLGGGGVDGAIHRAAGRGLLAECRTLGGCKVGQAKITGGYNLPCKHVIHTVGPIIADGVPTTEQEELLAQCYRSCLDLAEKNGLESIAFCCISTGVFHFPNKLAAKIAIENVKSYPRHALKTIVFNVFLNKDLDIYRQLLGA